MDKWKDSELNKMEAGGNAKALEFLKSQSDYQSNWSLQERYNSRAAALLRDKVRFFIEMNIENIFSGENFDLFISRC